MQTTAVHIEYSPYPSQDTEQAPLRGAIWEPLTDPRAKPGWGRIYDDDGGMATFDPETGRRSGQVANDAPVKPDNIVLHDGTKLLTKPNLDWLTGATVATPAPSFTYLCFNTSERDA